MCFPQVVKLSHGVALVSQNNHTGKNFSRDFRGELAKLAKGNRLFWQLPVSIVSRQPANSHGSYNEKSRSKVKCCFCAGISALIGSKSKLKSVTETTLSVPSRRSVGNVVLRSGASRKPHLHPLRKSEIWRVVCSCSSRYIVVNVCDNLVISGVRNFLKCFTGTQT